MKTCSVPGCENKYHAKGCCWKHYLRFKKYGDPLYTKIEIHGMWRTAEYETWSQMKIRCLNKNHKLYKYYGARGITICEKWRNSFIAFYADMGLKPFPKAQIDRINNNGNYEPGNCRWVTATQNNQHKSNIILTMKKAIEIRKLYKTGKIMQRELATIYGINQASISLIINNKQWI